VDGGLYELGERAWLVCQTCERTRKTGISEELVLAI